MGCTSNSSTDPELIMGDDGSSSIALADDGQSVGTIYDAGGAIPLAWDSAKEARSQEELSAMKTDPPSFEAVLTENACRKQTPSCARALRFVSQTQTIEQRVHKQTLQVQQN